MSSVIADPVFYLLAIPALLLMGVAKGGLGGGVGQLAVPMMALVISPIQAAAIMLPILCLMDIFAVRAYWGRWDWGNLRRLLPASLLGIIIGTVTFRYLDANSVRLLLGLISLGFVLSKWLTLKPNVERASPGLLRTGFWGAVSGYTSFIAHAGSPPVQVVLLPQRLNKTTYVGTVTLFFAAVNYAKLVPYGWLGQLDTTNLMTALVLSPVAPVGIYAGVYLHNRINERAFYQLMYLMLFVTGSKLTYDGLVGL